jgi:hypothetical protein
MGDAEQWTPELVEAELRAALWTLRRIPSRHLLPAGVRVAWPEVVREWEAYGWDRATRPRMQATSEQIRDMDRALGWVWNHLHPAACAAHQPAMVEDTGNIVLMRASGLTWEAIGQWRLARWMAPFARGARIPGGNSIKQLRAHQRAGIAAIVAALGGSSDGAAPRERQEQAEWGVSVEVAQRGESLGEGTYGPVHARAKWGVTVKRRG